MATATATRPPATVTTAVRASDSPASRPRVMPRARSTGNSAASRVSCRPSSCTMTATAMTPARPANRASATACGWMARSVAAVWLDRLMTSTFRPVAGYCLASAVAADRNAAMLAPGRSRMPAAVP